MTDVSAGSAFSPQAEAGRCVACGLCLPHCPTYRKTLSEADSPRGRIMLMGAVLEGTLPATSRFFAHLDQCLTCRACESACPNHVPYGLLVNRVRAVSASARKRGVVPRVLRRLALDQVVANPLGLAWSARALRVWQRLGGRRLARLAGWLGWTRLGDLADALPDLPAQAAWRSPYPATAEARGTVALFLGCVARALDVETLRASIFVLNRLGYTVEVPSGQTCCGALHATQGETDKAAALAEENAAAFAGGGWDAVIVTASGCAAAISGYPQTAGTAAGALAGKVREIGAFLAGADWSDVDVQPLPETVAVHEPCSQRHVLHGQAALLQLLQRIPGMTAVALHGNDQCCGAGGAYQLTQPEMSRALLADKVVAMRASAAGKVVSPNLGCALHLAAGARRAGLALEVVHPVLLLARQMGYSPEEFSATSS
jgi:glycolate oxidase iron-sulfur subunit